MAELVLVSGGSGAIGGAVCRELANLGYRPIVGYAVHRQRAAAIAAETGGETIALDLANPSAIDRAAETLAASAEPVAGVVLAASPPPEIAPIFKLSPQELEHQWRVNVDGPHRLLSGVVRQCMKPRKQGWLVGVLSSALGREGETAKNMGGYIVAKYGLLGLLRAVASEYGWLKVVTVEPGYTETPMLDAFDPRFLELLRERQPEGRFATPDEVARDIVRQIETVA